MHWKHFNCLKPTKGTDLQDANEIQLEGYDTAVLWLFKYALSPTHFNCSQFTWLLWTHWLCISDCEPQFALNTIINIIVGE